MELGIKNIGKIQKANIEINGITVIAGINSSAKSTIGKALYSVFNSFFKLREQIDIERLESIRRILFRGYGGYRLQRLTRFSVNDFLGNILDHSDQYIEDTDLLKADILEIVDEINDKNNSTIIREVAEEILENIDEITEGIRKVLLVSDNRIVETLINKSLNAEFNGQINNIYSPNEQGEIKLKIKDEEITVSIMDNSKVRVLNEYSLNTEVIYIDDPFVLDEIIERSYLINNRMNLNHREHLKEKLVKEGNENIIDELIIGDRLDSIFEKINSVCSGEMIRHKPGFGYKLDNAEEVLDIRNVSSGLKTFVIIKTLLQNGSLEQNGTIILDEPEIHLHPEWQLILAELIVLIQKEFGMHILLNTHSPYFLRAIEVYSANHGIADKCKYYLSENKGNKSVIEDVTIQTDIIYKKLAKPLEKLQAGRYTDD